MNLPPYGDDSKRNFAHFGTLKVSSQDIPNMTIKISPGGFWYYTSTGPIYVEFAGGNSPTITKPGTNAKWVIIALNSSAQIVLIDGSISAHPQVPTIPRGRVILAAVYVQSSTTEITNDMIFDTRALFAQFPTDHRDLAGTTETGSHPVSSISGLQTILDDLVTEEDLTTGLATKANQTGTNESSFILNEDFLGTPASDVSLMVERGSESNVGIKWNETLDQWQVTSDGSIWNTFGSVSTSGVSGSSGTSGTSGTSGSGTSGSSGTSGIAGSSGTSGADGTSGSSGTSGINGSSGTSGVSGSSGTSGSSGLSGSDGTSGSSGSNGTSGSSGTSGVDGTSGSSGTSGADGTAGSSGTSGADGTSGSSGTSGTSGTGWSGTCYVGNTSGTSAELNYYLTISNGIVTNFVGPV